jgi:hypothetical protein
MLRIQGLWEKKIEIGFLVVMALTTNHDHEKSQIIFFMATGHMRKMTLIGLLMTFKYYHYIRGLETLESLKINANGLLSSSISYCDDMYLCSIG